MITAQELSRRANNIRKNIIEAGYKSRHAHFGGSLSCVDILSYIFLSLKKENVLKRDRFILSKGHCALALYATLCEFGYISKEELLSFNSNDSLYPSHCVQNIQKGIEISSGSLGLGLSYAIGQAIALKKKGVDNKVYVLAGNGEANEGSLWEAIMFAGHKKVNNLVLVIDNNNMQLDGLSDNIMPVSKWKEKLSAFNWHALEINGNNPEEIIHVFQNNDKYPLAIVANTIKGKGVSFMENEAKWHHNTLTDDELEQAMKDLGI